MLLLLVIDLFIVFGLLFLGTVVILKDSRALLNRLFLGFIIAISGWVIANYFSNSFEISYRAALIANHITLFLPGIALLFLLGFSLKITGRAAISLYWKLVLLVSFIVYVLALTPWFFDSISRQGDVYAIHFTDVGSLYFLTLVYSMVSIVGVLIAGRRRAKGQQRARISAVLWGVSFMLGTNLATNALLPAFGGAFVLTNIGPLSSVVVIYAIWYSIIKHRLFDVRFFIARSVAYALLASTLALVYIGGLFGIAYLASGNSPDQNDIAPFISALIVVITAPPIKVMFDRLTNKLFYRDAYDPQTFLDTLNRTLVSNIEIGILLRHTATVIKDNFKAECYLYVKESDTESRMMGTRPLDIKERHFNLIKSELKTIHSRTVLTDELYEPYLELKNALYINEIAVISSLVTHLSKDNDATAYLMLGPKKSGSAYTKQDIRLLNIITAELLIAIQNALRFEEIQSFNVTLQNRINDATAKLKHSNDKLREMDNTKDEFISMASHQLRTPLTSVKGYLSMVLDGDAGKISDTQRQLLNQAFVSSQRMVYLIADLLNVSRLKTGKFVIDLAPTNLAQVVESEISQLTEVAKSKNITLTFDKPDTVPDIELDETKTRQVIMNFVDNAIYYTPAGGKIKIEVKTDRSSVYFVVKDNGMGVPKSEQEHLFTKFYRAKNAQKVRPDGTGLGLFMAKKVISEQGGDLLFESTEGKGSTFGFKFDITGVKKLDSSEDTPKNTKKPTKEPNKDKE